jgi:divalent anion:Na+ symporter, DASS family
MSETPKSTEVSQPTETPKPSLTPYLYKAGLPLLLAAVVYFLPVPDGVDPNGMQMLGIFLGTILALILQPLPTASVAIIGITLAMLTRTESAADALSGFGNATIWLIVAAFFIAEGFLITGLGRRIALVFVTRLGRSSLGLA